MSELNPPANAPDSAAPARWRPPIDPTVIAAALVGFTMGGMLGGAATGVAHASVREPRFERPATTVLAILPPAPTEDETAPVADDDDTEFDLGPMALVPDAGTRPRARRARTGSDRSLDSASYRVAPGRNVGYRDGQPMSVIVTLVDGKPVEVHTAAAFERMRAAAARANVQIRVVSGFRTMEHQRALYAAYHAGRGNLAAIPGHSNHQSGHALDLNVTAPGVLRWLDAHARAFGFRRTVPTENWHWEQW
jgi:hypothetical protein